jgi:ribosomal protein S18 acetylase RimI-like enzyme
LAADSDDLGEGLPLTLRIVDYQSGHEEAWLQCWALAAVHSHAWYLLYQQKPQYERESVELVACQGQELVGLLDIELERKPGELCLKKSECSGFAWEFAVHPDYWEQGIGTALLNRGHTELRKRGFHRIEFWSMDERSQRWYRRRGMKELARHYQFMLTPAAEEFPQLADAGVKVQFVHGYCSEKDWPQVQDQCGVIHDPPLEPHLTIGYEDCF